MAEKRINFKLSAEDGVSSVLQRVEGSLKSWENSFTRMAGRLTALVGGISIAHLARESLEALSVQEKAEAKLAAVLQATGNAAGFTSKQLTDLAAQLQKVTTFGDEATINTEAMLATFTKIRGDVFVEAIKRIQDMATVMDGGLKEATLQLGKALNDPIQGVSALREVGVSFNQQQQQTIQNLVATNRLAEAQGVILEELAKEFGGAAEAMARTTGGQLEQAKNAFGDLAEVIGAGLSPVIVEVANLFTAKANDISAAIQVAFFAFKEGLSGLGDLFGNVQAGMKSLLDGVSILTEGWVGSWELMETGLRNFQKTLGFVIAEAMANINNLMNAMEQRVRPGAVTFFATLFRAGQIAADRLQQFGQTGKASENQEGIWQQASREVNEHIQRDPTAFQVDPTLFERNLKRIEEERKRLAEAIFPGGEVDAPINAAIKDWLDELGDRFEKLRNDANANVKAGLDPALGALRKQLGAVQDGAERAADAIDRVFQPRERRFGGVDWGALGRRPMDPMAAFRLARAREFEGRQADFQGRFAEFREMVAELRNMLKSSERQENLLQRIAEQTRPGPTLYNAQQPGQVAVMEGL